MMNEDGPHAYTALHRRKTIKWEESLHTVGEKQDKRRGYCDRGAMMRTKLSNLTFASTRGKSSHAKRSRTENGRNLKAQKLNRTWRESRLVRRKRRKFGATLSE